MERLPIPPLTRQRVEIIDDETLRKVAEKIRILENVENEKAKKSQRLSPKRENELNKIILNKLPQWAREILS